MLVRTSSGSRTSLSTASRCLRPHSQITMTRQPSAANAAMFRFSRSTLVANFCNQKSRRVDGVTVSLQSSWRCQKQPCTKTQSRCLGKTMSGLPGNRLSFNIYRRPALCRTRRTIISGLVSFPRMPAIHLDLVSLSTMSVKDVPRATSPASKL